MKFITVVFVISTMNEVIHDETNPSWIGLETLVKSLNDELLKLVEFYFDKESIATLRRDRGMLSNATLNISKACLEVIDSTFMVMATMRSIVKDQGMNTKSGVEEAIDENTTKIETCGRSCSSVREYSVKRSNKKLSPILSLLEVAMDEMKNVADRDESQIKDLSDDGMKRKPAKKNNEKAKYKYKNESSTRKKK